MKVIIDSDVKKQSKLYRSITKIAPAIIKLKFANGVFVVNLVLVSSQKIKQINKKYRQKDQITDVISVGYQHSPETKTNIPILLGEIYICSPKAAKQAEIKKLTKDQEITILFAHGLMHLAGYHHNDPKVWNHHIDQLKVNQTLKLNLTI